jgi:Fic family protein
MLPTGPSSFLRTGPGVRAVLGHWLFGYIHSYPDGNGRMARFLMSVMLASGAYLWTIIRVEDRDEDFAALDRASIDADVKPFAQFVAERVKSSMDAIASALHGNSHDRKLAAMGAGTGR